MNRLSLRIRLVIEVVIEVAQVKAERLLSEVRSKRCFGWVGEVCEKDNDDYKDQQAKDGLDMISAQRNRYEVRNRGA